MHPELPEPSCKEAPLYRILIQMNSIFKTDFIVTTSIKALVLSGLSIQTSRPKFCISNSPTCNTNG